MDSEKGEKPHQDGKSTSDKERRRRRNTTTSPATKEAKAADRENIGKVGHFVSNLWLRVLAIVVGILLSFSGRLLVVILCM